MAEARPFPLLENLFGTAQSTWFSLSPVDWLEAFAAHPKIGSSESVTMERTQSAEWSTGEQSGMDSSDEIVHAELGEANRLYRDKFGFIFIVCATGKTAVEMLAICRARLGNSAATEFLIAAEEQKKITEIRLTKLLEQ
jgi:OHCU decarboxylase